MNATTAPTAAPANVRRVLTQRETFHLLTWYKEHQERLLHITDEGIIAEASQTLGIEGLKAVHLITARKSLGIQKRESRKPAPPQCRFGGVAGPRQRAGREARQTHGHRAGPAGPRAPSRNHPLSRAA